MMRTLTLLLSAALAATTTHGMAGEIPQPLAALEERGATIGESFDAPSGLTGYTVSFQGQTLTAYLTETGEHVLVGTLLDAEGNNLSQPVLEAAANAPRPESEWQRLADSAWIADGDDSAERVIYSFTDPNCPFCHRFYETSRDWVEAGQVQIRHVMVGVLRDDSLPKSATLLAAEDPGAALAEHEANFAEGGVTPADRLPAEAQQAVLDNNRLMGALDVQGTPSVFYRDAEGDLRLVRGLPQDGELEAVMGGPRPN